MIKHKKQRSFDEDCIFICGLEGWFMRLAEGVSDNCSLTAGGGREDVTPAPALPCYAMLCSLPAPFAALRCHRKAREGPWGRLGRLLTFILFS